MTLRLNRQSQVAEYDLPVRLKPTFRIGIVGCRHKNRLSGLGLSPIKTIRQVGFKNRLRGAVLWVFRSADQLARLRVMRARDVTIIREGVVFFQDSRRETPRSDAERARDEKSHLLPISHNGGKVR